MNRQFPYCTNTGTLVEIAIACDCEHKGCDKPAVVGWLFGSKLGRVLCLDHVDPKHRQAASELLQANRDAEAMAAERGDGVAVERQAVDGLR